MNRNQRDSKRTPRAKRIAIERRATRREKRYLQRIGA